MTGMAQSPGKRDTTLTCIPTWQLKESIKELLAYDACKEELAITKRQLATSNTQYQTCMSLVNVQTEKESIYQKQITLYVGNEKLYVSEISSLKKDLRKQRIKSIVLGTTGLTLFVGAGIAATYLALIR